MKDKTDSKLQKENADLRARLGEAEETLRAIREGEVDAIIVSGNKGNRVFSLSESENLHRLMVETMNEVGIATTPDGTILFCNNRATELLAQPQNKLLGRNLAEFIASQDIHHFKDILKIALKETTHKRILFQSRNGNSIPLEIWASHLKSQGNPIISLVATDLSQLEAVQNLVKQLRESEEKFRGIVETAREGIITATLGGNFTFVNQMMADMLGYPVDEILNKTSLDFSFKDLKKPVLDLRNELKTKKILSGEFKFRRKDGSVLWSSYNASPIFDSSGRHVANLAMHTDITERKKVEAKIKQAEEDLRQTRDYLENLLNYANAPIIVWDKMQRIFRFNKAFEHLTGYTAHDVIGKRLDILFPKDNRKESLDKIKQTAVGDYWESVEIPILQKDGEVRIVLWNSANIYDKDGKTILSTIAQGQDITARKNAELEREHFISKVQQLSAEAQMKANELEAIFKSMAEPLIIYDVSGKAVKHNQAMSKMLGFDPAGLTIRGIMGKISLMTEEGAPFNVEETPEGRALKGETVHDVKLIFKYETGREKIVLSNSAPIITKGKVTGVIVVWHDITETEKVKKLRDRMLRDLSHQLKTPLSIIEMGLERLSKESSDSGGHHHQNMDMILRNTRQTRELVTKILKLSRLESGSEKVKRARFDLAKEMLGALADLMHLAEEKRLVLTYHGPANLEVNSDRDKVMGSITNLAENAIKYTETGDIDVKLDEFADNVVVEVLDTGVGLSEEDIENVFNAFYKVDPSVPGAGVGLNIVAENMKLLGGSIKAESQGHGKGSVFKLTIPKGTK
ncbi:MAG: PAS domain S-box protein [Candidatus Altiarchaeota archaeon]